MSGSRRDSLPFPTLGWAAEGPRLQKRERTRAEERTFASRKSAGGAGVEAVFRAGIPAAGDRGTFTVALRGFPAVSEASAPRYRAKLTIGKHSPVRPQSSLVALFALAPTPAIDADKRRWSLDKVDGELGHVTLIWPLRRAVAVFSHVGWD